MKKYTILNIVSNILLIVLAILILLFFAFTGAFIAIGGNQDAVNQHMMIGYSLIALVLIAFVARVVAIICQKEKKTLIGFLCVGLIALSGALGGIEYFLIINLISSFEVQNLLLSIATPIILSLYYLLDILTIKRVIKQ